MSERSIHIKAIVAAATLLMALPFTASAAELVDPTRPSHVQSTTERKTVRAPTWRVESIVVSPTRRLAIINGRLVGVGERVNGAKVIEILPYEVQLEYQGETRRVSLVATPVKNLVK